MAWKFGRAGQGAGLFQPTPTIHQEENCHDAKPKGLRPNCHANESSHSDKSND